MNNRLNALHDSLAEVHKSRADMMAEGASQETLAELDAMQARILDEIEKAQQAPFTGKLAGYHGDSIECEHEGFHLVATVHHDSTMGDPWKEHDGHGIVSEWTSRDKAPGERILASDGRSRDFGGQRRYYDFAASVKLALKDGWDAPPYGQGTKRQRAARAVEADFQNLKAWCEDQWTWIGVEVVASRKGIDLGRASLWGIESNAGDYLTEVANELAEEALDDARATLASLCNA